MADDAAASPQLDVLPAEVLCLAKDFDQTAVTKIAPVLTMNKLTSLEMVQAIARREDLRTKVATEAKLELPEVCVLNAIFDRALQQCDNVSPRQDPTPDFGDLLIKAGQKFGNLPEASMLPANPATLNRMMKVHSAVNIDMREFHPLRDMRSIGSNGSLSEGSIPLRACGKTGNIVFDRDADLKKITSFTDFTCCFLRFAQTMSVFHPLTNDGKDPNSPGYVPGVSFYDLLAYWKRLYDNAVPLTVTGIIQYDRQYRDQLALRISQRSVSLSDGFRTDVNPSIMASAQALANHSAIMRGPASTQSHALGTPYKFPPGVCKHYIKGRCTYGVNCKYSHDLTAKVRQASGPSPYSKPSQYETKNEGSADARGTGHSANNGNKKSGNPGREARVQTAGDYQDGSGRPRVFPTEDSLSSPSPQLSCFVTEVLSTIDDFKLTEVLQAAVHADGKLDPLKVDEIKGLFERAVDHLHGRVSERFEVSSRTARVGGPLRPDLLQWLSKLTNDNMNDSRLCEEIDFGMALGFSGSLQPSGVFPEHGPTSDAQVTEDEVLSRLQRSFKNYGSAESENATVLRMIEEEVRLGRMRPLSHDEMWDERRCFSRVAAIPKAGSAELRLVEDYRRSKANSRINLVERVCLPRLRDIVKLIQQVMYDNNGEKVDSIGVIMDLKGAYRHIGLLPADRRYCSVAVTSGEEKWGYEHLMIPFGVCSAPWGFCRLSSKLLRVLRTFVHFICVLQKLSVVGGAGSMVYIDDFLWLLVAAMALKIICVVIILISFVGVTISWSKLCFRSDRIKFIGFDLILNSNPVMIAIPDDKFSEIKKLLRSVVSSVQSVPTRTLESLTGKLARLSMVCSFCRPFLSPFYSRLAGLRKHNIVRARVSRQSELFKALRWWQDLLENNYFRVRLPVPAPFGETPAVLIASDASATALGAWASFGPVTYWYKLDIRGGANLGWWRRFLEDPLKPSCRDMVFLETLAACLGLLLAIDKFALVREERIWVSLETDNTGTKVQFQKFRSSTYRINELLKAMALKLGCIAHRFDVCYVPSAENVYADRISRSSNPAEVLPESWIEVLVNANSLKSANQMVKKRHNSSGNPISKIRH